MWRRLDSLMTRFLTAFLFCAALSAAPPTMRSSRAPQDAPLIVDPKTPFWKDAPVVIADHDIRGKHVPRYSTEIRSRWTPANLYLLFTCPYEKLNLKPDPSTTTETFLLWNWDVAEAFVGWDFNEITRYKEFEVSPQGEWVDLDIDRKTPLPEGGWKWNSGFEVKVQIDEPSKIWYGAMRIPFSSIDTRPAKVGNQLRINLFRSQGPDHQQVTWQPPMAETFHKPERFGILELVE